MRKLPFIFLCFYIFLSGCASNSPGATKIITKKFEFTENSTNGLVILSRTGELDFNVSIDKFDTVTKKIIHSTTPAAGNGEKNKTRYTLNSLEPGRYIISKFTDYRQKYSVSNCLRKGTFTFNIKKGEILYLGNFDYNFENNNTAKKIKYTKRKRKPIISKGNINEAKMYLQGFPNINGELSQSKLSKSSFVVSSNLDGCG